MSGRNQSKINNYSESYDDDNEINIEGSDEENSLEGVDYYPELKQHRKFIEKYPKHEYGAMYNDKLHLFRNHNDLIHWRQSNNINIYQYNLYIMNKVRNNKCPTPNSVNTYFHDVLFKGQAVQEDIYYYANEPIYDKIAQEIESVSNSYDNYPELKQHKDFIKKHPECDYAIKHKNKLHLFNTHHDLINYVHTENILKKDYKVYDMDKVKYNLAPSRIGNGIKQKKIQ
jgi:hypothetical protein